MYRWLKPAVLGLAISLGVNYAWEMAQVPFFSSMASAPLREHARRCLGSAAGDVLLAGVGYLFAGLTARSLSWPRSKRSWVPTSVWVFVGLVATAAIERMAVANGRWTYGGAMPTISGVGLLPLLQWLVVPIITLSIWRALMPRWMRQAT